MTSLMIPAAARGWRGLVLGMALLGLAGCGSLPWSGGHTPARPTQASAASRPGVGVPGSLEATGDRREVVMYAMGLLGIDYQFGGKNPESGLDCSGMVSYIYQNAVGVRLPHNAAQIAKATRPISAEEMQAGDLVFFNTMNRPFSHMGIYLGEGKFIHAPSSNKKVRVDSLRSGYFAKRFEAARTALD